MSKKKPETLHDKWPIWRLLVAMVDAEKADGSNSKLATLYGGVVRTRLGVRTLAKDPPSVPYFDQMPLWRLLTELDDQERYGQAQLTLRVLACIVLQRLRIGE